MISRVTLPGRLSATRVGSLRNTVPRVSPRSVCTTTLSPILNQRLRELRKNALRAPRSATWTMSDIVDLYGAGEQAQTPALGCRRIERYDFQFPARPPGRAGYDEPPGSRGRKEGRAYRRAPEGFMRGLMEAKWQDRQLLPFS